ncbi:MAG: zinc ribbon domain-containing protein [Acidobacteriota bacterium]
MAEVTALGKFSCPSCGGEAHWNPARKALVCPFCGTVAPGELQADGSAVRENDLAAALRSIPDDQRGWQTEKRSVRCRSCDAISVFSPERVAQRCDFCGSSELVPYEEIKAPLKPESLLPFRVTESTVRETIRKWYGSRWFAPDALKKSALTDTIHGLYLPYWTFDAKVFCEWTAEAGYYYYTTESYRDSQGRSRTRQVRHTRWEPSSGALEHFFDDELVPASKGVSAPLLRKTEPFPTADLVPYDPGYVSGWVVEHYQIDLVAAAQRSREIMEEKALALCAEQVPGDTHRNLNVDSRYSDQTFKHVLLPVWLLSYNFGSKVFQVLVNGYTGTIAGDHPLSWIKITLAVIVALIVVLIFVALGGDVS